MNRGTIVLHGMNSPNVRKVVIMLEELGLAYELRHVAVFTGAQFAPEFLAKNPLAKVPVLEDPRLGGPLAESGAILHWLAEREDSGLLPASQPARAQTMQWLMIQMSAIGPMLGQLNHFQLLGEAEQPYALGRYREQARRLYRVLDDRLNAGDWLAGTAYSIADIATYPWATYLEQHGFEPSSHAAMLRWRDAVAARPATKRAAERMHEAFTPPSADARMHATPADLDRFFGRTEAMPAADFSVIARP